MAVPTEDEARAILRPYHGLISHTVHEAWAEWRKVQAFRASADMPPVLYHTGPPRS